MWPLPCDVINSKKMTRKNYKDRMWINHHRRHPISVTLQCFVYVIMSICFLVFVTCNMETVFVRNGRKQRQRLLLNDKRPVSCLIISIDCI